jgi:hypothetical protein
MMDALAPRYYRLEPPQGEPMAPHRVDLAVWCHQCVSWCLKRTVRRGWSQIPPAGPAQRPLYSVGTSARIERLRVGYPSGCGCPRPPSRAAQASQALWWEEAGRRQF